ncbi:hypothetical protein COOONC_23178 [Cooperia oncophora]
MNSIYGSPMKTYSSSPDIPHMNSFELAEDDSSSTTSQNDDRLGYLQHSQSGGYFQSGGGEYSRPFRPAFRPKTPPPPPPPPQSSLPQTPNSQRLPSSPYGSNHVKQNSSNGSATTHIVVPTPNDSNDSGDTPSPPPLHRDLKRRKRKIRLALTTSGSADFQADLRNALAKRRSKVAQEQDDEDKSDVDGYTSSRTSLEPSEYGEERGLDANSNRPHFTVDGSSSRHNVALISQNIEDSYGARKNIDNMSVSSTLSTLSGCSSESRPTPSLPVVPPVDYDDPDSGTGGSDSDMQNAESGSFERKVLLKWTCADALQWLISLGLDEYLAAFQARRVDGRALLNCDRAAFTQLGVTRIAHRQKMEASLRRYMGSM